MSHHIRIPERFELWPLERLQPYERNARTHSEAQVAKIAASILEFGFTNAILVDGRDGIIAGHGRLLAARQLAMAEVPVVVLDHLTEDQRRAYVLADNRLALDAGWDEDLLGEELAALQRSGYDLTLTGFNEEELADLIPPEEGLPRVDDAAPPEFLIERFGVPPFSILDTRQGYWQERKRKWRNAIGENGESREETLFKEGSTEASRKMAEIGTVSILDPVLSEIMLRWFCPKGGMTFDTFAGDTIFGAVSSMLGRPFVGIELREEQARLNNERTAGRGWPAKYINDDGQNVLQHLAPESRDFFFSCPPYFNLEVYSDDPRDASNQNYEGFRSILDRAFSGACRVLRNNRFACVVMSNVRDKRGFYHDICGDIRAIMARNGLALYNEIVLINSVGSASMRAGNYMRSRKVARTHQNVMIFYKGEAGDAIELSRDFDVLERLEAVQFHEEVMIFYKGNPSKIKEEFSDLDEFDALSGMDSNG